MAFREGNGIRYFVRQFVNLDRAVDPPDCIHHRCIKICRIHRCQAERRILAIAGSNDEAMINKVEVDDE